VFPLSKRATRNERNNIHEYLFVEKARDKNETIIWMAEEFVSSLPAWRPFTSRKQDSRSPQDELDVISRYTVLFITQRFDGILAGGA
jgi:hypothetical protein